MKSEIHTELQFDKEKAASVFRAYVAAYNENDSKVKLKIEHTFRVALLCEQIAESLSFGEKEKNLAWLLGLLHDVGRFEQLRRYGTFNDAQSIDHAAYGADILFAKDSSDTPKIRDYITDDSEDELIENAIRCHSAYRVPQEFDERTRAYANILRDADKIDILKVNIDIPMEEIYNVTTEELYRSEVSKEVMESFFECHATLRSIKKTPIDNLVGHISLVYELVYPLSRKLVKEQGYLERMMNFQSENPKTREQFAILKKQMEQFLEK